MKNLHIFFSTYALFISLSSCEEKPAKKLSSEQTPSSEQPMSASTEHINTGQWALTDQWIGKWNGPEGTFFKIAGSAGKYELIIQDLDGPKSYSGVSVDNAIQFQRNGILEKIRATSGEETGMKWLNEKRNCLTINRGEGFCRD